MLGKITVLFLLLPTLVLCTRIIFNNYCPQTIVVGQQSNEDSDVLELSPACKLLPGYSCFVDYSNINWIWYQNGFGFNGTCVTIKINDSGYDYYSIRTNYGFDFPMQLSSTSGPTYTCLDKNCPDSYDKSQTKQAKITTGKSITVNWCPFNYQVPGKLSLVAIKESTKTNGSADNLSINPKHNPPIIKPKI